MLISIITVCKNSGKTIKRTFDSYKSEITKISSNHNVEYIVIDGASSDNTIKIINSYKNEITKFVSEPDNGIFHAMNKGWELASGEYVMFLNSDDFLANGSLKSIIDLAHIAQNDNFTIITGTTILFNKKKENKKKSLNLIKFGLKELKRNNPIPHPSTLISKKLLEQFRGFDNKLSISADYDFFVRALKQNDVKILAVDNDWVFMDDSGVSNQYHSIYSLIKIERELFHVQASNYNFLTALFSFLLRILGHIKYFFGKI